MIRIFLRLSNFLFIFTPLFLPFISLEWLEKQETICLYTNLTGESCYGCGITKSIIAFIQFDFLESYHFNKIIIIVGPLLFYLWLIKFIEFIKIKPITKPKLH